MNRTVTSELDLACCVIAYPDLTAAEAEAMAQEFTPTEPSWPPLPEPPVRERVRNHFANGRRVPAFGRRSR